MTAKELNSLAALRKDKKGLERVKEQINEVLGEQYRGPLLLAWEEQARRLDMEIKRLSSWIDGIPNMQMRALVIFKYFFGMTWEQSAKECGYYSAESAREAFGRYMKKEAKAS